MRKRGCGETPSVIGLIRGVYKCLAIRTSELIARVRNESRNVFVVYKEVVKETAI